jgi:hypothetical protein
MEYGQTPNGEHKVSLFLEASAWAALDLGPLPNLAVEAGIGGRLVYVKSKRLGIWQPAPPEMYLFGGDLDNYTSNAWELNIRAGEDKPENGNRDSIDEIIDHLRRMQFTKRFMVTLGSRKLMRYKHRLQNYKSLVGSDAQASGATLKAAVTVDVDLGNVDFSDDGLIRQLKKLQGSVVDSEANPLKIAKDIVSFTLTEGGNSDLVQLFENIITKRSVINCTIHAEAGYGGGISGKVGAGAKLQVDLAGSVGLVYEQAFTGDEVHRFIKSTLSKIENANPSVEGNPHAMPLLANAINSNENSMEEFATIVMGAAE